MADIILEDLNPGSDLIKEWQTVWNSSVIRRQSGGYVSKNYDELVNILNYSIIEVYPSGLKAGTKPLLVTSNEKLFQLVMMSKNQYDKALKSKICETLYGMYVNPECGESRDKDGKKVEPKWVKTRNIITGNDAFIKVKAHTMTGRGVVIPHPGRNETLDDKYMLNFKMFINNLKNKKN